MGGFEASVVIHRPLREVAAYLSDLANDPGWRREWVGSEATAAGPVGVGATTTLFGRVLGRRITAVYAVSRYEPDRLTQWRTVDGPLPLTFHRAFESVDGGTRVTFRYDATPNVLLRLLEPVVVGMGRRRLAGDLPGLRAVLER